MEVEIDNKLFICSYALVMRAENIVVEHLLEDGIKRNLKGCSYNVNTQYILGICLWGDVSLKGRVDDTCLRNRCILKNSGVDNLLV